MVPSLRKLTGNSKSAPAFYLSPRLNSHERTDQTQLFPYLPDLLLGSSLARFRNLPQKVRQRQLFFQLAQNQQKQQYGQRNSFNTQSMLNNQFYKNEIFYRAFEGMNPTLNQS